LPGRSIVSNGRPGPGANPQAEPI